MTLRKFKKHTIRKVIGIHSCLETLKVRPKKIRSIYIQNTWKKNDALKKVIEQARRYKIDFFEQTASQLASWGSGHQGVALIVEDSPSFSFKKNTNPTVFLFLDGIEDPRNLGAIIRTAWLMDVKAIFLPRRKGSITQLTSTVSKVASGGAEHIPVEFLSHPKSWFKKLKKDGFWIYGLDRQSSKSLWEEVFHFKTVLVVGSEGKGIQPSILSLCDQQLLIPQKDTMASYNLSVSVALGMAQIKKSMKV